MAELEDDKAKAEGNHSRAGSNPAHALIKTDYMKLAPIKWKAHLETVPDAKGNKVYNYEGKVNGQLMFIIDRKNIKEPLYVLKSYPFTNDVFTRANNYKILFEHHDPEKVKRVAETKMMNFISKFTLPASNPTIQETIADIAYAAGIYGYYSGDSRADMQTFIHLAEQFEKKYKDVDWEDLPKDHLDYMEAVDAFAKEELKLKSKLMLNYPHAFDEPWDNIEIERCREEDGSTFPIHDDNDVQPNDFYSVYAHQVEGGVMCIADVPTEEAANELRDTIAHAVKTYKDNGHM